MRAGGFARAQSSQMAVHAVRSFGALLPAHGFAAPGLFARAGVFADAGTGPGPQRVGLRRPAWPPLPRSEALDDHSLFRPRRTRRAHPRALPSGKAVRVVGRGITRLG